jgi:hypothetical protein
MIKFIILVIVIFNTLGVKAVDNLDNVSRGDIESTLKLIDENIVVGFSWIDIPLNQILLLKHKKNICAIKFNSFKRLEDNKKATTFRSSAETFLASYSKYEFNEIYENTRFDKITEHKLVSEATVGIGRLTFGGGDKKIKCGDGYFHWEYPTGVFLNRENKSLSFYPLLVNDFTKIDKLPLTIPWIGYEENRVQKIISNKRGR